MASVTLTTNSTIDNRNVYFKEQALSRVGETRINTLGSIMWIDRYTSYNDILVKFDDGHITHTRYDHFCSGNVKNPNDISVYGRGRIGVGTHLASLEGKHTHIYLVWFSMLTRCYSSAYKAKHPTYRECTCSDEWFNFQTFATWYCKNSYESKESLQLDKDILSKGNKLYSANKCILVPGNINLLFIKRDMKRGKYPVGVQKRDGRYRACCSVGTGSARNIGIFNTEIEAFNSYKIFKENHIKSMADKYQCIIPQKLYQAMYAYEVSIDD